MKIYFSDLFVLPVWARTRGPHRDTKPLTATPMFFHATPFGVANPGLRTAALSLYLFTLLVLRPFSLLHSLQQLEVVWRGLGKEGGKGGRGESRARNHRKINQRGPSWSWRVSGPCAGRVRGAWCGSVPALPACQSCAGSHPPGLQAPTFIKKTYRSSPLTETVGGRRGGGQPRPTIPKQLVCANHNAVLNEMIVSSVDRSKRHFKIWSENVVVSASYK